VFSGAEDSHGFGLFAALTGPMEDVGVTA